MTVLGASTLNAGTLVKVVLSSVAAGIGVTVAFSTVIYCADRASELRRDHRGGPAAALTVAGLVALAACIGLIVYGLVLITSKR
jgi:hypothetical protein